jgi:hypothetical protein
MLVCTKGMHRLARALSEPPLGQWVQAVGVLGHGHAWGRSAWCFVCAPMACLHRPCCAAASLCGWGIAWNIYIDFYHKCFSVLPVSTPHVQVVYCRTDFVAVYLPSLTRQHDISTCSHAARQSHAALPCCCAVLSFLQPCRCVCM